MITALFQAALFVLIGSTVFALATLVLDRIAPQTRIRERHDLALALLYIR